MKHLRIFAGVAVALAILTTTPAGAQSRVFVSGNGDDAHPCTFTHPCRTFQRAYNVVAANGESDVIDPAGYGACPVSRGGLKWSTQHGHARLWASKPQPIDLALVLHRSLEPARVTRTWPVKDADRLATILKAKKLGFTLSEIRRMFGTKA